MIIPLTLKTVRQQESSDITYGTSILLGCARVNAAAVRLTGHSCDPRTLDHRNETMRE